MQRIAYDIQSESGGWYGSGEVWALSMDDVRPDALAEASELARAHGAPMILRMAEWGTNGQTFVRNAREIVR